MKTQKIVIIDESVMKFSIKYLIEYLKKTYPGREVVMLEKTYYDILCSDDSLQAKVRRELSRTYTEILPEGNVTNETISSPGKKYQLSFMYLDHEKRKSSVVSILHDLKKTYDILFVCNNQVKSSLARRNGIQTIGYQINESSFFEVIYTLSSQEEYNQLTKRPTIDPKTLQDKIVHYHQKFLTIRWESQEEVYCLVEGRWMLSSGKVLVTRINNTSLSCYCGDSAQVDANRRMGLNSETSAFSYILSHMIQEPSVYHVHMSKVLRDPLVIHANEL